MMTPRERLRRALNHQEPDRVPIDLGGMQTTIEALAYQQLLSHLGLNEKIFVFTRDHVVPSETVLNMFNVDTRYVYYELIKPGPPPPGTLFDEWGIGWRKKAGGLYYEPFYFPLREAKSVEDLKKHKWPGPPSEERLAYWRERAEKLYEETNYALVGDVIGLGILETAWALQGLDRFMINLCRRLPLVEALLDKVLEIKIQQYETYLDAIGPYINVINLSDDMGTQSGPLISPPLYRKLIKPRHKALIEAIKRKTQAKVFLHSCGAIYEFIPDFIEIGIDILNPIQVSARGMGDTARLKKEFGKDLVFWGGSCDSQHTLPFGTPEEVRKEAARRIEDLKPGGGYVFAPIHNIQPYVPPENVIVLFETAKEVGTYYEAREHG